MTAFHLKLLAMLAMLIDHAGNYILGNIFWMRLVGRLAFVLYAFMVSEGLKHSRDKQAYLLNLLTFSLVSSIPYSLMTSGQVLNLTKWNVGFTLLAGAGLLYLWERLVDRNSMALWGKAVLALLLCLIGAALTGLLNTDYGWLGVPLIFLFYFWDRTSPRRLPYLLGTLTFFFLLSLIKVFQTADLVLIAQAFRQPSMVQAYLGIFLAAIPLALYQGQKGLSPSWFKRLYWWFYPLHQLVIWLWVTFF